MTHRIQVVPNSGHHFYWVPFDIEVLRSLDAETVRDIDYRCKSASAWQAATDHHGRPMPWVRFKFSMGYEEGDKVNKVLGVEVAIESNLGDVSRGSTFVPPEEVVPFDFAGQPSSPYAFMSERDIADSGHTKISFNTAGVDSRELAEVEIAWTVHMAQAPIPVDLIVDFGNTRTVAILLEETPTQVGSPGEALRQMVRPLRFTERGQSYSETGGKSIVDSWFVLHEPQFQEFEPPQLELQAAMTEYVVTVERAKKSFFQRATPPRKVVSHVIRRLPQSFVELSPIALGCEAPIALRKLKLDGGGVSFLSSPKRYAWDNHLPTHSSNQNQLFWTMVRNGWNPQYLEAQNATLACQVLRFFPHDGSDWHIDSPPTELNAARRPMAKPVAPIFPRADALAWMALAVIEAAYRQMNTPEFWKDNYPYVRRVLRSIQVTHPSGWMAAELEAYKSKWQKAVNTFTHGHLWDISQAPRLEFPIDEAIASQLPIVFAEIQQMHGIGENWLELIGRRDAAGEPVVRAMTIDIGGGTTDYAIVEYRDKMKGAGVELAAQLLFKDSTNIAGDEIVRGLIERVLLPKLGQRFESDDDAADAYSAFFRQAFSNQREKETWKRITRLALVPLVTSWLDDLCHGRSINPDGLDELGVGVVDPSAVQELNNLAAAFFNTRGFGEYLSDGKLFNLDGDEDERTLFDVTEDEVAHVIHEKLRPTIRSLAKFAAVFEVDLVIVSGKPSELPMLQQMVVDLLPITRDRVVCAKGFFAGDWYPYNEAGKISDAKTVTAIGLALHKAIHNNRVPGWSIQHSATEGVRFRFYWVGVPSQTNRTAAVYLTPDQDSATVELMINTRIGRRLLPSSRDPEPTYLFRWVNGAKNPPARMAVTLQRVRGELSSGAATETLEIRKIAAIDSERSVDLEDVSLDVCTLSGDEYWLDTPRFRVTWPE